MLLVVALLAVPACEPSTSQPGSTDRRVTPEEASAEVSMLLYERNLIADPEVHARMNECVLAVSRDGVPIDSAMRDFHNWLQEWADEHPDRLEAARSAARPYKPGR
jgi:hypothetical protein